MHSFIKYIEFIECVENKNGNTRRSRVIFLYVNWEFRNTVLYILILFLVLGRLYWILNILRKGYIVLDGWRGGEELLRLSQLFNLYVCLKMFLFVSS